VIEQGGLPPVRVPDPIAPVPAVVLEPGPVPSAVTPAGSAPRDASVPPALPSTVPNPKISARPAEYVQWPEGQRDANAPRDVSASLEAPPSGVLPAPIVRRR
jgi:hypothetical protein